MNTENDADKILAQCIFALQDTTKCLEATDDPAGLREHLAACQRVAMHKTPRLRGRSKRRDRRRCSGRPDASICWRTRATEES